MSFLEELKATAGQVLKKVGETVGELKDRASLEIQIQKLRGQVRDAEESSRAAHEAMGKRVYELYKQGQVTDRQLINGCEEVEALARRVDELNAQMVKAREEAEQHAAAAAAEGTGPAAEAPKAETPGSTETPRTGDAGTGPTGTGKGPEGTGPR